LSASDKANWAEKSSSAMRCSLAACQADTSGLPARPSTTFSVSSPNLLSAVAVEQVTGGLHLPLILDVAWRHDSCVLAAAPTWGARDRGPSWSTPARRSRFHQRRLGGMAPPQSARPDGTDRVTAAEARRGRPPAVAGERPLHPEHGRDQPTYSAGQFRGGDRCPETTRGEGWVVGNRWWRHPNRPSPGATFPDRLRVGPVVASCTGHDVVNRCWPRSALRSQPASRNLIIYRIRGTRVSRSH